VGLRAAAAVEIVFHIKNEDFLKRARYRLKGELGFHGAFVLFPTILQLPTLTEKKEVSICAVLKSKIVAETSRICKSRQKLSVEI
jgi:hypothetical protein